MKVVTVVGARPQFVKAGPVSKALRKSHTEILVHTGQHYDYKMSSVFFDELNLPEPDTNLEVGSGTHGAQTAAMLVGIEQVLITEQPDWVLVYGDTNSTLAGALAAAKMHIKVAHVEAGLRSYNRMMPEELNRVLVDHVSDLLFCPGETAAHNLKVEGITRGVHIVGDVMIEALASASDAARAKANILEKFNLEEGNFLLTTVHRAENTDDPARLANIISALSKSEERIVFPVHPRTRQKLSSINLEGLNLENILFTEPLGYLDFVLLEQTARIILTDSGGIQKEAYWLGTPCVTLREETEWVETVESGWNVLAGADEGRILSAIKNCSKPVSRPNLYGDGRTAEWIEELLSEYA
jgi:UDP-GlcNAc3NAcA epimerase